MAETNSIAIPPRVKDLTGRDDFGRWTVLAFAGYRYRKAFWLCRCECGTTKEICGSHLTNGGTQSCGCLKRDLAAARLTTHGLYGTPGYNSWSRILDRCYNQNSEDYQGYGGRGITVCERWITSFEAFYLDMGSRPAGNHISIERIDNNGNYEPGNCKWATKQEQARNTRRNVLLTFNGKTQCLTAWAEELGMGVTTLFGRLNRGWSVERVLNEPIHRR